MEQTVPIIYTWRPVRVRLAWWGRLVAAAVAGGCLAVLLTALWLDPNPNGVGTHHQLGLQPCYWLSHWDLPCPTCGMTTSFAYLAHGKVLGSLYVQPMATVLALLVAMGFWAGLYIALTGRPAHRLLRFTRARYYILPLSLLALAAWVWKMVIHLRGQDGWGG